MCRLAAWIGAPLPLEDLVITPRHSLLTQSQDATEAKLAVNGDGFGIAWYHQDEARPGLYRDVLPAWSDGNLPSLCRMIRASIFLAHVRASTGAETSRSNCHPFSYENWSFMHNGQLGNFARIRRTLEEGLPDKFYELRRGSTDSELLFLLLLAEGLYNDPAAAVDAVLARLESLRQEGSAAHRITMVMSDGVSLYCMRHASDDLCPTLYLRHAEGGTVVASEPLEAGEAGWQPVLADQLWQVSNGTQRSLLTRAGAKHAA